MKVRNRNHLKSDCEKPAFLPATTPMQPPAGWPEGDEALPLFFTGLDDPVFVFEPAGRILFTNPAAQKQLGYSAAELADMSVLQVHPLEQRAEATRLLASLTAGKITVCPIPLLTKNGSHILAETKILPGQWHGTTG